MLHRNSRVNLYTYLSNLSEKRLLNKDSKTFLRILKWPLKWPWQYSKLYISILLGWKSCQDCNQLMQTMCFFAFFACLDWTENNFVNWKNKLILLIFQSASGLGFLIRRGLLLYCYHILYGGIIYLKIQEGASPAYFFSYWKWALGWFGSK